MTVKVTASDGAGGTVSDSFDLAVNAAPTVANAIPDQAAKLGRAFSYTFPANTFADANSGDTLTYTATRDDDTALPSWLTFTAGTRTFSGTPQTADAGTVTVKVTASDDNGRTVSDTFDLVAAANAAPTVANAIADQAAEAGTAFSFQFAANTFSDADSDTLTYTATKGDGSALPAWLTFTASSRTFSGTPAAADAGTVTVKVTASDGAGGTVSDSFDLAVNAAPTVANAIPDQAAKLGRAFSFQFAANTFSDANSGDTLTYTATRDDDTALPAWLTFTAGTRTFSGTPQTADAGTVTVKVTASDDNGRTVSDTFDLVAAANNAPTVANAIADQDAEAGTAFSFQFAANTFSDADSDTLTYTATKGDGSALPAWLTFTASSRTFSGTPAAADAGTVTVKVTASDGADGTVSDSFDLAVNAAPTVANAIPDQAAKLGRAFSYTFPANTFADANSGDTLTYTATRDDDTALPAWLTFTAGTRTFSGTPQAADAGTVTVKVTASDDNGRTVSDTFDLVAAANNAPTVANAIADQDAEAGTAFSFQFAANTFSDADSDTLTYTATKGDGSALPAWLTFTASSRTFSGTPAAADAGTVTVKVTASDGADGTVSDSFDLAVNAAPTVANAIPDQAAKLGRAFSYTFPANTFADANSGDTLTYTATRDDDTALPSWLTFTAGTRTFSGTPQTADAGTVTVKVTASDDNGRTVSDTFDLVAAANNAPTVANAIADQDAEAGTAFSFQFAANTFSDADSDTLTYTATKGDGSALPAWLTFTASSRTFSGTPAAADAGTVTVKVTASDGADGTVSDSFDLAVNAAPTVANAIPDQAAKLGRAFSYTFPANTFADANSGDTLTYTATRDDDTALPLWLTFTAGTRTFSGTPQAADAGTVTVKVTASDDNGRTVSDTFDLVAAANNAPTVANAIADQDAEAGTAFSFQFAANTFSDADSDTLTYTATKGDGSALPAWLTFTASSRTFSGTPAAADAGTVTVKVTASDGADGTVSDSFDLAVNAAPTVANAIPDQAAKLGRAFSYTFPANTFADANSGDTLTYTATRDDDTALPSWLTFTAGTRTFSGTPQAADAGTVTVKVTASDDNGRTVSDTFDLVAAANNAPTVANAIADQDAEAGTAFSFQFAANTFSDADSDTLTYTATKGDGSALPAWLGFTASSRTFSGTPAAADAGTVTVKVTASDGAGGTVSDSFDLAVNAAPTVANAIPDQAAKLGRAFSYTFPANTFADANSGDTLTYTATRDDDTALPSWLTFTASSRTFSGTPRRRTRAR